jgi:butyryl-CoA dehydrogenase
LRKVNTTRFFMTEMLPESNALFAQVMDGGRPVMDFEDAAY